MQVPPRICAVPKRSKRSGGCQPNPAATAASSGIGSVPDRDQVDVLALSAAEQPVPDESADEVHLDVQGARGRRDRFEDVLELRRFRGDLADGGGHGSRGHQPRGPAAQQRGREDRGEPAQSAAPRKTARSSVTIAAVTSRS